MTKSLAEVVERLARLPESEQAAFAVLILDGLESEQRWNEAFARSPDELANLAEEALAEYRSRKSNPS